MEAEWNFKPVGNYEKNIPQSKQILILPVYREIELRV